MKPFFRKALCIVLVSLCFYSADSESVDVTTCPGIVKRSNGNGQASLAAGDFRPQSTQNNVVAPSVTGINYQLEPFALL